MDLISFFQTHPTWFTGTVFLFSLVVGSFLNVVIYRLPLMMERDWRSHCAEILDPGVEQATEAFNLVVPRSRCPACQAPIRAWHNIPVVSYLLLGGRCADCGVRISLRYPLIEVATATLSALVAWRLGFGWACAAGLLLTWSLIAASAIDIDHQLLPDTITLLLVWGGLVLSLFHGAIEHEVLFLEPRAAIIGAIAGYLSLWSVYWLFKLLTRKEGMGHGDFKLLAGLGAWLGWQMLPLIIVLSAFVGALVGVAMIIFRGHGRSVPIPFGPYLAAAGWIAMLWGRELLDTYLTVSGMR